MMSMFMSDEVHGRFHAACKAASLPHPGALKTMLHLKAHDPPSMRALAEYMNCDASYVTSMVDLLEDLDYVERRVSPTDRRVKLLALTPVGEGAIKVALDVMLTPPAGVAGLSAAELRMLRKLVEKASSGYTTLARP
jgi:DNA-binding MarR family transcriptional regulator